MPFKQTFKAIIFDLDGTLVNSLSDIAGAMNKTLEEYGFPTHSLEDYKYFIGNGIRKLVERSLPENQRTPEMQERCTETMLKEYRKVPVGKTHLFDGIPELLDVVSQKGLKMSILSNKADVLTQEIYKVLLSKWNFEVVLGASDRFPTKPSPESAVFIGQSMSVPFSEILYVGDTNTDMQTATAAGFFPVGATWGYRTEAELLEAGAKYIVHKPMDLTELIK